MQIITIPYGPLSSNMFIISYGGGFIIVDPSVDPGTVSGVIEGFELSRVRAVLITHGHFDHIYRARAWQDLLSGVPFIMSDTDRALLTDGDYNCSSMTGEDEPYDIDTRDVSMLSELFGDDPYINVRAVPTPGHTSGSVTFEVTDRGSGETVLFSGDTVFMGSVGRTDFPTGNLSEMMESIGIFKGYPVKTAIYPGHGPATDVGTEIKINPYF